MQIWHLGNFEDKYAKTGLNILVKYGMNSNNDISYTIENTACENRIEFISILICKKSWIWRDI